MKTLLLFSVFLSLAAFAEAKKKDVYQNSEEWKERQRLQSHPVKPSSAPGTPGTVKSKNPDKL